MLNLKGQALEPGGLSQGPARGLLLGLKTGLDTIGPEKNIMNNFIDG